MRWQYSSPFMVMSIQLLMSADWNVNAWSLMTASRSVSRNSRTRFRFALFEKTSRSSITFGCLSSRRNLTSLIADMSSPSLNWPTLIWVAVWISRGNAREGERAAGLFYRDLAVGEDLFTEVDDGVGTLADLFLLGVPRLDGSVGLLGRLHDARPELRGPSPQRGEAVGPGRVFVRVGVG